MRYLRTASGGIRPAKSNTFKYARRAPYWHPVLDTTVLYMRAFPADSPEYFNCYRFFGDGRAYYYGFTSFYGGLDTAVINDTTAGSPCWYYIRNGREIWIQQLTLHPSLLRNRGAFLAYSYGLLDTGGMELLVPDLDHHVHRRMKAKSPDDRRITRFVKTGIPIR